MVIGGRRGCVRVRAPHTRLTLVATASQPCISADRKSIKVTCFQRALQFDLSASIDMVKNTYSPSTTLLSSGRKEYSATKITAYFSPKPSPIASPQVPIDAQAAQPKIETNSQIVSKIEVRGSINRIETPREAKATSTMPVATRKRSAQARDQPYPAPAPAPTQAQLQQPLRAVSDARSNSRSSGIQTPDTPTPASSSAQARNSASAQVNGHIAIPRPLDLSRPPASDPLIPNAPVNVKSVLFGDLTFDCSYSSRHVREIIGDKVAEGKEVLKSLCVCPHCFKYTEQIVQYGGHLKVCPLAEPLKGGDGKGSLASIERGSKVPGKRVYKHGVGWEVWEVDGEDEQVRTVFFPLLFFRRSIFDLSPIYLRSTSI